jgi:hypothetical protein
MRTFLRGKVTLLFMTLGLLLAFPAIVLADDFRNNIDATFDANFEVLTMLTGQVPAQTQTVNIVLQGQGSDGEGGCNVDSGEGPVTVKAVSSNSSVASVKWASTNTDTVNFTDCAAPNSKNLTVTAGNTGSANVTFEITNGTLNTTTGLYTVSATGSGTYDVSTARFTVNVTPPPNTPPTVSVTGVTNGAIYDKGAVPAAGCTVVDAEDTGESATPVTDSSALDSDGLGSETVTCSYTDGGTPPLTTTASATYTIRDPSAPVITHSVTGQQGNNGWYTSDVDVDWTVSEPQSPNSLVTSGCDDFSVTSDQGETTYTCSATSSGGGPVTDSVTIKRDATGPLVTANPDSPPDHNGWYNQALTVSFSGQDDTSGIANCDPAANYSGPDNASASVSGSCTDNAGNSASGAFAFQYDATAPTINHSLSPAANGAGWNNTDVLVDYSCTDATSDVASCGPDETLSEGENQSSTGNATDNAGNTASDTVNNIDIDKTDPSVALVGGPNDGSSHYFGFVPSAPTCTASDALSGLAGACSVSGYGTTVGSHTVTASATDNADNTNSASNHYTVLGWDFRGFYQPVDMGTTANTVKGGSTVPIKFELFAGSNELTETSRVNTPLKATKVGCDNGAPIDDIELTATGGTSLRYDTTGGQYIYNWQTPKQPGVCYDVTITATDGSSKTAHFKLK